MWKSDVRIRLSFLQSYSVLNSNVRDADTIFLPSAFSRHFAPFVGLEVS